MIFDRLSPYEKILYCKELSSSGDEINIKSRFSYKKGHYVMV